MSTCWQVFAVGLNCASFHIFTDTETPKQPNKLTFYNFSCLLFFQPFSERSTSCRLIKTSLAKRTTEKKNRSIKKVHRTPQWSEGTQSVVCYVCWQKKAKNLIEHPSRKPFRCASGDNYCKLFFARQLAEWLKVQIKSAQWAALSRLFH